MLQHEFGTNPNYLRYSALLRELHLAMSSAPPDEVRADEIRDEMDGPWLGLSPAERERLAGLSGDLYSLEDKNNRPAGPTTPEGQSLVAAFQQAFDTEQWDLALAALRKADRYFSSADASLARGSIWNELGDRETAILFYRHAGDLSLQTVRTRLKAIG